MAQNFRRETSNNIGTGAGTTVFSPSTYDTVVGIRVANITTGSINVGVYIYDGSNDIYLCKSAPIPAGSSLEFIDSGSKIVVQNNDVLKVESDTAAGCDVWVSYVKEIST